MHIRRNLIAVMGLALVVSMFGRVARADSTFQIMLGDADGLVYDGPGSVDDVYVDPTWLATVNAKTNSVTPEHGFDIIAHNHNVPFTFQFDLDVGETVTAASLALYVVGAGEAIDTDSVFLEAISMASRYQFEDLGWLPVPSVGVHERIIDLADMNGQNLLGDLQDGQLNVLVRDDVVIDYATLTYSVSSPLIVETTGGAAVSAPLPAAVWAGLTMLGGLGTVTGIRRRTRASA